MSRAAPGPPHPLRVVPAGAPRWSSCWPCCATGCRREPPLWAHLGGRRVRWHVSRSPCSATASNGSRRSRGHLERHHTLIVLPPACWSSCPRTADRARAIGLRSASSACWWCSGVWQGVGGAHLPGNCCASARPSATASPSRTRAVRRRQQGTGVCRCRPRSCSWRRRSWRSSRRWWPGCRRCHRSSLRVVCQRAGPRRARHRPRVRDQLPQLSGWPVRARRPPSRT